VSTVKAIAAAEKHEHKRHARARIAVIASPLKEPSQNARASKRPARLIALPLLLKERTVL
jgi:hypothetical protein